MVARTPSPAPDGPQIIELAKPELTDAARWDFINLWQVADQADDRKPMDGGAAYVSGSNSAQRSIARRTHQAMYKEWSRTRHD
jgi:hypothetical protein